jgi:hypothetical protein
MTRIRFSKSWLLAFTAMLMACDSLSVDDEHEGVETVQSPIVGGHEISMADSQRSGVVLIADRNAGKVACSSTLLNASWLITAQHCFPAGEWQMDGTVSSYYREKYSFHFGNNTVPGEFGPFNPTSRMASKIIRHPGYFVEDDPIFGRVVYGPDVALVRLSSPAPSTALPAGSYPNGRMRIYPGTNASTVGKTLTVYGYGKNHGPNGVGPWDSLGILRSGWLDVRSQNVWVFWMKSPQGSGTYITNNGDSGGPAFLDTYSGGALTKRELVGVHSESTGDIGSDSESENVHAEFLKDFITTVVDEGQHPVAPVPGIAYKARLHHSRKCLDVYGGSTQSGAAVIQWTCHGNANQRLTLVHRGERSYSAVFSHSQQCLEVRDGSTADGAAIVQRPCNGSDRQIFELEDKYSGLGRSRLRWKHSMKCANLNGASLNNGVSVVQYPCHEGGNQYLSFLL